VSQRINHPNLVYFGRDKANFLNNVNFLHIYQRLDKYADPITAFL